METQNHRNLKRYAGQMAESAQLIITRDHPQDVRARPVYLWIDGEKYDGVLRYGKSFTLTGGGMVMVLMMGVAYLKVRLLRL